MTCLALSVGLCQLGVSVGLCQRYDLALNPPPERIEMNLCAKVPLGTLGSNQGRPQWGSTTPSLIQSHGEAQDY